MTRHDELLAEILLGEIRGLKPQAAVARLFEVGLVNRRICEQRALKVEVARLERQGVPRCEGLHLAAEKFCCSYEKARSAFYQNYKP